MKVRLKPCKIEEHKKKYYKYNHNKIYNLLNEGESFDNIKNNGDYYVINHSGYTWNFGEYFNDLHFYLIFN